MFSKLKKKNRVVWEKMSENIVERVRPQMTNNMVHAHYLLDT